MSAAHERVVGGSLPRDLTATLIDRASDHARVAVSYDVSGGKQVNDKGAVTQVLKPQHLSFKAYLEDRNARWKIVETS